MRLPTEMLHQQPLFSWLPEEGFKTFASCFDMEAEELPAGGAQESRGRIGYLLSGSLRLESGSSGDAGVIGPGTVFGILHAADGHAQMEGVRLRAVSPCTVIWMNREIMTSVCYFDCWFHGRFITEMQRLLTAQRRSRESL